MKDNDMRSLRRQLVISTVAILFLLSAIVFSGSLLFSDIVRQQNVAHYQLALDFARDATEQVNADIKSLFDQMLFSPQFDKLMNYASVDHTDLLVGLKQLGYCRNSNAYVDSIYLYNAQNDTFYITSDYSTQSVQPIDDLFDQGAAEIVRDIHVYSNLTPIERTTVFAFPFYKETDYVTFVRFNSLSKGKTNVYMINVEASKLMSIAETMKKNKLDRMFFAFGGEVILQRDPGDDLLKAARMVHGTKESSGYIEFDGKIAVFDKSLPFNWTLIYLYNESGGDIIANETGLKRVAVLIALVIALFAVFILILRYWIGVIKKKNNETKLLNEEKKQMKQLALRHSIVNAMANDDVSLLPDQTARVCRLIMLVPREHKGQTLERAFVASTYIPCLETDQVIFDAEDNEGRIFLCTSQQNVFDLALAELSEREGSVFIVLSDEFTYPYELSETYRWCVACAEYKTICTKRIFTSEDLAAREAHAPVQQNDYANYINAIQSLDEENASGRLLDLIMTLGAGSIHAYRMGIMTIMIQSSNALSQLRVLLPASEEAIDSSTLIDAEPGDAYTRINDWLVQAMRDCIDSRNSKYDKLAEEIEAYIDENCGDVGFTAETIADRFGFSTQYLSRVFKKQTGEGLSECITAARIRKAKALLSMTDDPIANIAAQCGFLEAQYFHRVFKSKTGMTPGTYRQETRSKAHEGGNNG